MPKKEICRTFPDPYFGDAERNLRGYNDRGKSRLPHLRQFLRCGSLLPDGDTMSLHSPVEAAVADVVRRHIGIAPTRSECAAALGRYRHGSYLDAAKEVYAAERQQLELLSLEHRAPANRVRAENCYVEPQQPAWGGVDLATGGIGEKMVRTEDGVAAVRDYMFGSQLTSTDGA